MVLFGKTFFLTDSAVVAGGGDGHVMLRYLDISGRG